MAIEQSGGYETVRAAFCAARSGDLFHPVDGFEELQKNKSLISAFVLILLTLCVRVATIYMTSFHITSLQPKYANLNLELIRFVVPLISGVIACYLLRRLWTGGLL